MSWTMRLFCWRTLGNASFTAVMKRTKKSKHIEYTNVTASSLLSVFVIVQPVPGYHAAFMRIPGEEVSE